MDFILWYIIFYECGGIWLRGGCDRMNRNRLPLMPNTPRHQLRAFSMRAEDAVYEELLKELSE